MIDGHLLAQAADVQRDITYRRQKAIADMARGGRREAYAYQGTGFPLIGRKFEVTLRYDHIRSHLDLVEELFATPGPHEVVLWQRHHEAFPGDGARVEFTLPRVPLLVDPDEYTFPPLFPQAWKTALAVEATVGIGGTVLAVVEKTGAGYEAGDPTGTEAWFVAEQAAFKVGTAPTASET